MPTASLEDRLLASIRDNDHELFRQVESKLFGIACRIVRGTWYWFTDLESRECAAEACYRLVNAVTESKYEPGGGLTSYFRKIVCHLAIDHERKFFREVRRTVGAEFAGRCVGELREMCGVRVDAAAQVKRPDDARGWTPAEDDHAVEEGAEIRFLERKRTEVEADVELVAPAPTYRSDPFFRAIVEGCIGQLGGRYQETMRLWWEGWGGEGEIGKQLGKPAEGVRNWLSRGRKMLEACVRQRVHKPV